jgi:O-glycosyl hydrolase
MYWATKHYSGLIDSGAKLVQTTGHYDDGIAFVNPDGTKVVELLNERTSSVQVVVSVDNRTYAVQLPPTSFATVMVPAR